MIGKITPLLVQEARRRTWLGAVAGHIAGSCLSAGVQGYILGSCGSALGLASAAPGPQVVGATFLLACAARDVHILNWPMPALRRQTPAWFLCGFGPFWGALIWGVDLAQGWTTTTTLAGYFGIAVWAMLSASPAQGALLLGTYGLGRALPVLTAGLSVRGIDLTQKATAYAQHLPLLQRLNGSALAFLAGFILLSLLQ